LIGGTETKTVYQEGDKIPPAAPPKKSTEDGKVYYGLRISMSLGLANTDWAKAKTLKTLEEHSVDAAAAASNSTDSPDVKPHGLSLVVDYPDSTDSTDSPDSPDVKPHSLSLVVDSTDSPDVKPHSLSLVVNSPDSPNVSSRSLSPADSPDFSPQSHSSSRGKKRRNSSPPPNYSRDASRDASRDTAAKRRRVLVVLDDEEENREYNNLLKETQSLKQKLNEEKKKRNDLSVQYEMLKKEFQELRRQKRETDLKLQKTIEDNDILISKLAICACKCLGHKEDCKKGSYYPHLGYGSSEEDLKDNIVKSSKIERQQILF
jgi:hypothetical protein